MYRCMTNLCRHLGQRDKPCCIRCRSGALGWHSMELLLWGSTASLRAVSGIESRTPPILFDEPPKHIVPATPYALSVPLPGHPHSHANETPRKHLISCADAILSPRLETSASPLFRQRLDPRPASARQRAVRTCSFICSPSLLRPSPVLTVMIQRLRHQGGRGVYGT